MKLFESISPVVYLPVEFGNISKLLNGGVKLNPPHVDFYRNLSDVPVKQWTVIFEFDGIALSRSHTGKGITHKIDRLYLTRPFQLKPEMIFRVHIITDELTNEPVNNGKIKMYQTVRDFYHSLRFLNK